MSRDWRQVLEGKTVHLAFYCHTDWQWEQSRRWHEERYALVVREVLEWMRRTDDLTMVMDNVNEFLDPVWKRLTAAERDEFSHRVEEGRIAVAPAGIANGRPTHIGDETFIRNLVMGRWQFATLFPGSDLGVFHSVDVSIGHSQMPQLLTQAGFDAYRAWRPEGPLDADGVPRQFIWEGLDGSTILVMRGPYGSLYLSERLLTLDNGWEGAAFSFYDQVLAAQLAPGRTPSPHLMAYVGCDDARPFRTHVGDLPFDLPAFLAEWRRRETVPIVFDRPCDVRDAVLADPDGLPTVHGVLDGAECGYNVSWQGNDGLWWWRSANDLALVEAERWASLAWWRGLPYPEAHLAGLWRDHLTYQAHAQEAAFAPDFAELIGVARRVRQEADRIAHEARLSLVAGQPSTDGQVTYVCNPHSWPVDAFIEVYHACPVPTARSLVATDGAGQPLPSQVREELRHPRSAGAISDARLLVRVQVPAGGMSQVRVIERPFAEATPVAESPETGLLTGSLALRFDGNALRRVSVVGTGRTYVDPGGLPWPCLTYHATGDVGWYGPRLDRERLRWQPEEGGWLETGPHRWCHRATGSLAHFRAEVLTYAWQSEPRLDFTVLLYDRSGGEPPPGYVTLGFPLPMPGRLWADIPFGVEERDPLHYRYMDRPGAGAEGGDLFERPRTNLFWARSWVHWTSGSDGLTLVSVDGGIYYLYEEGCLAHFVGRWMQASAASWEERAWPEHTTGGARHSFRYSLFFGDGGRPTGETVRFACERRMPMSVEQAIPAAAVGLGRRAGLSIDGPAVLSAAYVEGGAYFVRLFECEGSGGEVTCHLPGAAVSVSAVDFCGDLAGDVEPELAGDEVRLHLRPWQIATLRLERRR